MGFWMDINLSGAVYTDEKWSSVGASAFKLSHDWFSGDDIVIRTAAAGGGTLLVKDTDYSLGTLNTQLTADSGLDVYKTVQVTNVAYQAVDLYISGKYIGDSTQAEDFYPGAIGQLTAQIKDDSGTLKITTGFVGIDDDTLKGVYEVTSETTISMAAVSNSNWAKIELAIDGNNYDFTAADIAGETDPGVIPSGFTGAYDSAKGGFYIDSTKRVVGLAWKNAGGTLEGVVNCLPYIDGYQGYSTSDDANDFIYRWEKYVENTVNNEYVGRLHIIPDDERPSTWVLNGGSSATFADIDFSAYVPKGVKAVLIRGYVLVTGNVTATIRLRKNGSSVDDLDQNGQAFGGTAVDGGDTIRSPIYAIIESDNDGIIEYRIAGGTVSLLLTVDGYYLPENAG